jgi:MFS family permease
MAQDTSGAGAAGGTLVIPGEMAARVDRLPMSFMAWEICLIVQVGWAMSASTDGIAARLYPFVWLPAKTVTHSQYDVLYAFQAGISIVIGGYALGWLADKIGRRKALILSSVLAGVFIWPFGYVTNYPALIVLSIADTLGFAGYLAINVVYMSEIMGPTWRRRVMLPCQTVCIFLLFVVVGGILPHYWFPVHYRWFLWFLAIVNLLIAVVLFFRMPESPRWLEARERRDQARQAVARMEARVMKRHPVLPDPDLQPYQVVAEEKTSWLAPFGKRFVVVTVFLLFVMVLGYAGIVYGGASQIVLFLIGKGGYSAGFIFAMTAWAGVVATVIYVLNAFIGDRLERRWTQLIGAICFAGGYFLMWKDVHSSVAVYVGYTLGNIGVVLWLWSMYVYIPQNYPTRMRALGTGWTDGIGHLGAWGGVLIAGALFSLLAPNGFFLFVTIPCALLPGVLIAIFGKNQRNRTLEELSQ